LASDGATAALLNNPFGRENAKITISSATIKGNLTKIINQFVHDEPCQQSTVGSLAEEY
jgi:hypothetical protein